MHPSQRLKGSKDSRLEGSRIIMCVSGSIAAVESVKLARELIRHGAEVIPVMSHAALRIITSEALTFACGIEPITELTGQVEHISVFSDEKRNLVLVAPATGDVISKIATGIADDALTTVCFNALGMKVPMLMTPAMGNSMLSNPFLVRNIERLRRQGVTVLPSLLEEGEAKMIDNTVIMENVTRALSKGLLKGRNVLVIGGASEEPIDDVRLVSSRSTGRTAIEISTVAFEEKASVALWCGRVTREEPPFIRCTPFESILELMDKVKGKKFDIVVVPASLSDYLPPKSSGKIPSSKGSLKLELRPAPKLIETLRKRCKVLVGFKAEVADDKKLIDRAKSRLKESGLDMIVANNLADVKPDRTRAYIVTKRSVDLFEGSKRGLAEAIVSRLADSGRQKSRRRRNA